ncbi:MAG: NAD-dependent epimerase/dehydratase family protein [Candidatus Eisenbacteria bacterium]|uniref:NAD-dependent epimerase/dehydratase family protein n=1 Tax=Eiseniibacteriota bacterium TaxID=2212470 RepID=A0A538U9U5_UNCEI|nr:MAG: NAD-dependent epimerase/dehydratase family protein [Candidatus Eisenbacteria bacterium]
MNVLVAGGAGMIGSHLCEQLLMQEHRVICMDNLCTGRLDNIRQWLTNPLFTWIDHDIIEPLPELPPINRIYHLASPASPPGYTRLPIETMRVNSEGTFRLLTLAAAQDARFLYASTSEAYGDPHEHPQREEYRGNVSTTGPRSMYDEAKRYGEALTMTFVRSRKVDGRIVRIFNTYGPRCDPGDGRVVVNFIVQALRGDPMTVYGNGRQTRSLCYVSDLVEALTRTMEAAGAHGQLINLGNPDEHTVLEFSEIVRDLCGSHSEIVFAEAAVGDDPQRRRPDISRARALLDWQPQISLHVGLARTIAYLREVVGAPRSLPRVEPAADAAEHRHEGARVARNGRAAEEA